MQKSKEKNNVTVNFKGYTKDEYRCISHTTLGLLRSSPTFIQIAGKFYAKFHRVSLLDISLFHFINRYKIESLKYGLHLLLQYFQLRKNFNLLPA